LESKRLAYAWHTQIQTRAKIAVSCVKCQFTRPVTTDKFGKTITNANCIKR